MRPWSEDLDETHAQDSFDSYYKLVLPGAVSDDWDMPKMKEQVRSQIENQRPTTWRDLNTIAGIEGPEAGLEEVRQAYGLTSLKHRSPIWDVAILSADSIGYVHDECLLEVANFQGTVRNSFLGRGHGSQLFRTPKPLLYVVEPNDEGQYPWNNRGMMLAQVDGDQLHKLLSAPGTYTFSVDRNGIVLGRRDRSFQTQREDAKVDLILDLRSREVTWHDLGQYDVFNHYLRVDGAPALFFLQGTPNSSHRDRYLSTCNVDGRVEPLWPLLEDQGDHASHAVECCFCYVDDEHGSGMVVSGKHYDPSSLAYHGFIYRKNLDGREIWRCPTRSGVSSMQFVAVKGVIMAAFLDGSLGTFRAKDGAIVNDEPFNPDGQPSVIYALSVGDTHLGVGTIDGRCGLMPISQLAE